MTCNHFFTLTLPQNTFSQILFKFGFDFFQMLTVDLLHKFELGVWKDFLTHLIHILESLGPETVQTFNERYARYNPPVFRHQSLKFTPVLASNRSLHLARQQSDILRVTSPR
jgi:hypothetical protein